MAVAYCDRLCCGGWCTHWAPTEDQKQYWPLRHSDFRDTTPQQLENVYRLYQPVVERGRWTHGLLEMWFFKNKPVKHAVHIPCWDSFKWNPLRWRGVCLGRTMEECFWTGTRQMRWARAVYAANLGREYVMPVRNIGRHGYKSDIKALCWMYCLMSCIFSCGIGQLMTCCGSTCLNFGAWYSCHARERLRRRYNLPPACALPPGIDDCLVHFFCGYCAAHQEARELALRGIDGPGMHILDVLPGSFPHAKGIEEAKAVRREVLGHMLARPPKMFRARNRPQLGASTTRHLLPAVEHFAAERAVSLAGRTFIQPCHDDMPLALDRESGVSTASSPAGSEGSYSSAASALGWYRYCPPEQQEMRRCSEHPAAAAAAAAGPWPCGQLPGGSGPWELRRHSVHSIPVIVEQAPGVPPQLVPGEGAPPQLQKAWSVAY